jgi:NAD(P)-dependent dehydrogenase (short-subunit alcohol dehydrogenase family)
MAALQGTAIVVGVGSEQGLGAALSRRFAREGYKVLVSGRTEAKLARVVRGIVNDGGKAEAVIADATIEAEVVALFDRAERGGADGLDLVVFNAGNNAPHDFRTMPAQFFEQTWRVATLGGFLVGREAARRLAPRGRGTVIFTGATASLRGRRAVYGIRVGQSRITVACAIDGEGIWTTRNSRRPCCHRWRH